MGSSSSLLFYTRKRWGKGFQYFDPDNQKLTCKISLKRIKALVIPPMWEDVQISTNPKSKIQVTGRDAKNRKQYIYNEAWQERRQAKKFSNVINFAEHLPRVRERCLKLIKTHGASRQKILSLMLLILDETGIRVGNRHYTKNNQTHGLTTLRRKHVESDVDGVTLSFVGKSSKSREVEIEDDKLSKLVKQCADQPGYQLFRYKDDANKWQDVDSDELNQFIRTEVGEAFSAKDFRTWNATCLAVEAYYRLGDELTEGRGEPVNKVIKLVAERLGNTVAVCRQYYIHPKILRKIETLSLPSIVIADDDDELRAEFTPYEIEALKLLKS